MRASSVYTRTATWNVFEKKLNKKKIWIEIPATLIEQQRTIDPMEGKPNVTTDIPLTGRENADGSAGKNSVSSGMEG